MLFILLQNCLINLLFRLMEFWSQVLEDKNNQNLLSILNNNPFLKNCGLFPQFHLSPPNFKEDPLNLRKSRRRNKFSKANALLNPYLDKSKGAHSQSWLDQEKDPDESNFIKSFVKGERTNIVSKFNFEKKENLNNLFIPPKYQNSSQRPIQTTNNESNISQTSESPKKVNFQKLFRKNINNPEISTEKSISSTRATDMHMSKLTNSKINKMAQRLPIINIERQLTLQQKFGNKKQPFRKDKPLLTYQMNDLSHIKADSYLIMQYPSNQLILVHNYKKSLEIASLTKIMTFYVVIKLAKEFKINIQTQKIQIQEFVEDITGTSAELVEGDILTIQQLLYGLMLPSGNDAAMCLANWGGRLITEKQDLVLNVKAFVQEMNRTAKQLGLKDSRYGNPHGLPNFDNRSTVYDVAQLISICLVNQKFCEIINTKNYNFYIKTVENKDRQIVWQNTNKLLRREGFIGVKTGITVTAGPCLATCYVFKNRTFIAVLLRTNKVSRRFKQTRKILYYALKNLFQVEGQDKIKLESLRKNRRDFDSDNSEDEQEFIYSKGGMSQYARRNKILKYQL